MNDYIAYHSTERMGYPFEHARSNSFSFFSGKPEKQLRGAIDQRVWVIVGERIDKKQTYRFAGMFVPSQVEPHQGGFRITGPGTPAKGMPTVTGLPWFARLFKEQNQFSFGFNRTRDSGVVTELERLLRPGKMPGRKSVHPLEAQETNGSPRITEIVSQAADEAERNGDFDILDRDDARRRTLAAIVRRQGQPKFRRQLLQIYDGKCAFSNCSVREVLEAAHILPYKGTRTNHPQNGLLLRADLHTLFDLGLLSVETRRMTIVTAASLAGTEYEALSGKRARMPKDPAVAPSRAALDEHRANAVQLASALRG